jgi:predicted DNA repair protein MutK
MSVGLLALLDDVAAIAKVAAASIDDVAGQAAQAGAKAAGAVIDDAAMTPNYVEGFAADRELPIVGKIALGSIRNKLIILLPIALLLSSFMPWLISPLLTFGGAYLCFEGAEKVFSAVFPHAVHATETPVEAVPASAVSLEETRVAGAIKTDFILSAEIMTIALGAVTMDSVWLTALVLALVSIGITVLVYGGVALIVKADDVGLALARKGLTRGGRAFGRLLVRAMPGFMNTLSILGTAAMIWVGGSIVIHGLASFGLDQIEHFIEHNAAAVVEAVPPAAVGIAHWLAEALQDLVVGLVLGSLLIPLVEHVIVPVYRAVKGLFGRKADLA